MGPRSPFVLYALIIPFALTLLVQGIFGDLFAPVPRLDIVDDGASQVSAQAGQLEGIEVTFLDDRELMLARVEANDADAGLYLPADFDDEVRSGAQPELSFVVGGESLASNRIILGITTLEMVRAVEGSEPPVMVTVEQLGDPVAEISDRMLPLLLMMVVAVAAGFLPAASLVQEREDGTLSAMLVSPASIGDVMGAKGLFGVILGMVTGVAVLFLNNAVGARLGAHVVVLVVATVMMAEIGLLLGAWAKDSNTLFAAWKGGAILLVFPAVFYLFPDLPQWIARLGPTYYFLDPAFRISNGETLADVIPTLAVGVAICVILVPLVWRSGRRLEQISAVA